MEETPEPAEVENNYLALKDQLVSSSTEIELPNNDAKEKPEENIENCDLSPKTKEKPEDGAASPSRNSPDPSCAICLGQLQNKSFTDSCFHMFCFTCLVEWSKVKAECPLCKQRFKSIVHNVRSIEDYDQYYITSKNSETIWSSVDGRRFRYHSTLTADRMMDRRRRMVAIADSVESRIVSHRLMYAPHSVRSFTTSEIISRIPCNFRRRIYEDDLWVRPNRTSGKRRSISPDFYRQNPACTHRLLPWLNRELVALLHGSESQVTFVLELIMALIMRYDIQSQEFFVHIEPYLAHRTSHFVHEFYNFASSPFDMELYDRHAAYSFSELNSTITISPGGAVVPLTDSGLNRAPSTSGESQSSQQAKKTKRAYKRLQKLVLKRNHENDSWQSVATFQTSSSSSSLNSPSLNGAETTTDFYNIAGPSTSGFNNSAYACVPPMSYVTTLTDDKGSSLDDDSDCLIVHEGKPRSQRTPEIVNILSSDEDEPVQTVTLSSDENSAHGEHSKSAVLSLDDSPFSTSQDIQYILSALCSDDTEPSPQRTKINNTVSDLDGEKGNQKTDSDSSSQATVKNNNNLQVVPHMNSSEHEKVQNLASPTISSTWSRHQKPISPSWSLYNRTKPKSDSYHASTSRITDLGSSTDSCSEVSQEKSPKAKKLKLRSVVAQISNDHHYERSDSSRHSSHKRHKEKRKKKKKHGHKHKYHSYSGESD